MQLSEKEKKLLKKLESRELDGIIPGEDTWKSMCCICRKIILNGIPCFISISTSHFRCYPKVVVEQYYETDEMKLWFLKMHGKSMSDPDVVEYSHMEEVPDKKDERETEPDAVPPRRMN